MSSALFFGLLKNTFDGKREKYRGKQMPPLLPSSSYPSGSASMTGIYQGLPRRVQACLCSSGMALHYLRNVDAWPAHGGRGRWTTSVKWYTHTHTKKNPHPPLSPMPDDLLVYVLIAEGLCHQLCFNLCVSNSDILWQCHRNGIGVEGPFKSK